MLNLSIRQINRLSPRFVILSGDMQNWYADDEGNGQLTKRPDVGDAQVAGVKQSLSLLDGSIPLKATMPGNHDLGNAPTLATLARYEELWGADKGWFDVDGVRFVYFNTQILQNASMPGVQARVQAQATWLNETLRSTAAADVEGVVLLAHIPPFIGHDAEPFGWANWPPAVRHEVLGMTQGVAKAPRVVVCGHFHGNVERVESSAYGAPLEVRSPPRRSAA